MIFDMKNPFTNIPIKEYGNGRLASSVILIIATFTYELAMSTVGERFAQRLASNDLSVRNRALKRLSEWIKARSALEDGKSFKKHVSSVSLCGDGTAKIVEGFARLYVALRQTISSGMHPQ